MSIGSLDLTGLRQIYSRDNPHWRELVVCAQSARERRKRGLSFLEGEHLCEAWLDRWGAPRLIAIADSAQQLPSCRALLSRAQGLDPMLTILLVDDAMWRDLSQLVQGVSLAFLIETPQPVLPERLTEDAIYLDRVQDPGNVGSILRTAVAAGIDRVFTAPGTAWVWSPKVLRAGMGAHFALQVHESVAWADLEARVQMPRLAARPQDASDLWSADLRSPALWLFGNEGAGLDPLIDAESVQWVRIPQSDLVESLNVAAAAAVCLFEQRRQRLAG
jgi:TrmH family RNA methyltransferase